MEFTAEQKLAIEADVKEAGKFLVKAFIKAANAAAVNSENKVDDLLVPVLTPAVETALLDLFAKLKL